MIPIDEPPLTPGQAAISHHAPTARARRRTAGPALAAFCLLAAAAAALPAHSPPAREPDLPRHELVFARHGDDGRSHYDLWRMCGDGTQLASLVVAPGTQFQPAVSPDGEELVYTQRTETGSDLLWQPIDRGDPLPLAPHPARDSGPAYSPDGRRLAFFSTRDAEKPELYLYDFAGESIERLTVNEHHDSGAAWTPDGGAIVFTRYFPAPDGAERSGDGELVRLDLATREERTLTALGGYNGDADVSPDGTTIAFHRVHDGGAEIWLVDADGSNPRAVTDTFVDEYTPRWSPDGDWLAVTVGVGHDGLGTFDLWLLRPDGGARRLLHAAANTEAWHVWRRGESRCR